MQMNNSSSVVQIKFSLVTRQNNRSNYNTFPKLCSFFPKFESEMTASSNGRLIFLRHYANERPIPQRGTNFTLSPPSPLQPPEIDSHLNHIIVAFYYSDKSNGLFY